MEGSTARPSRSARRVGADSFVVRGALVGGLIAVIVAFVECFLLAVVTPTSSAFDAGGSGVLNETLLQTGLCSLVKVNVDFGGGLERAFRITPAIFALLPLAASFVGGLVSRSLTPGLSSRDRIIAGAAIGIPFGFALLLFALLAGSVSVDGPSFRAESISISAGGAFLMGLLWGAIGGSLGVIVGIRREPRHWVDHTLRGGPRRLASLAAASLIPLGVALLITTALGTAVWIGQTIRNSSGIREDRPAARATLENGLYAIDHGVHFLELGTDASFRWLGNPISMPFPVAECTSILSEKDQNELGVHPSSCYSRGGSVTRKDAKFFQVDESGLPTFTLFAYSRTLPAWAFIPLLITLVAVVFLAELYAGFALARLGRARKPEHGVRWGALVGPVWAVSMLLLNALVLKEVAGKATGDSVFIAFLVSGSVLGAVGGWLASREPPRHPADAEAG
ncbi:MAG: hypothetical protein ACJ75Z_01725 [Solirubrobacterales bacterium]